MAARLTTAEWLAYGVLMLTVSSVGPVSLAKRHRVKERRRQMTSNQIRNFRLIQYTQVIPTAVS